MIEIRHLLKVVAAWVTIAYVAGFVGVALIHTAVKAAKKRLLTTNTENPS